MKLMKLAILGRSCDGRAEESSCLFCSFYAKIHLTHKNGKAEEEEFKASLGRRQADLA